MNRMDIHMRSKDYRQSASPWANALILVACLLTALAVLAWLKFGLGLWHTTLARNAELSSDPARRALIVGTHTLSVPGNMIDRSIGEPDGSQAHLVLLWPQMRGFSDSLAGQFKNAGVSSRLIHVTIAAKPDAISPIDLFNRVYAPNFQADASDAPPGLSGRMLDQRSGYGGETAYFDTRAGVERSGFFIRCSNARADQPPADCLRTVPLENGLILEYRYRRALLKDWRMIETGLIELAERSAQARAR